MLANGLDRSPDRRTLVVAAARAAIIRDYDHDPATGAIRGGRIFVALGLESGVPDWLPVGPDRGSWGSLFGARVTGRIESDRCLDRLIRLPVSQATSCAVSSDGLAPHAPTARLRLGPAALDCDLMASAIRRIKPALGKSSRDANARANRWSADSRSRRLQGRANGGEGGIRTPGTLRYSAFRVRRDRPLCHLSVGQACGPLGLAAGIAARGRGGKTIWAARAQRRSGSRRACSTKVSTSATAL